MEFLEKDLEQIIWESDFAELLKRGLYLDGKCYRQKRIGHYGVADLITVKRCRYSRDIGYISITIYELKRDKIGIAALLQSIGYAQGVKRYLEEVRHFDNFEIRICLIGSSVDTSGNFIYITDLLGSREYEGSFIGIAEICYYTYNYKIDGIHFKDERGYKLSDEGF